MKMTVSGPLFDGRYGHYVEGFLHDAKETVGQQGLAEVHANANASFVHPTPYYETQLQVGWMGEQVVVDDRNIVYGPWLESGRSTTRFRGYGLWRKAAARLQRNVPGLIQPILARYLAKMRGEA